MKGRARRFGESGGHQLLADLQRAAGADRGVRFHLMGHSFGCIVMSATLAGPSGRCQLVRQVDSVALVQGALSLWSYAAEIPDRAAQAGYFHSIVSDRRVSGPIITTQSEYDTAVGRWYPLAAGAARQVAFAPGEWPKYGAVGTHGLRNPGPEVVALEMLSADAVYGFEPGRVYNLESSRYICEGGGASGAHSDIAKPEVAHAVWAAALSSVRP
jgi:pimeloyl-ACP methyl ester carboxylesterase